jgi:tRNA-dihydrouridine synthase A
MGAALMAYPELVREMVESMRKATKKPVTVKHRIGIDGKNILPDTFERTLLDKYEDMVNFVTTVEKAIVDRFIIHARIAILEGVSPKENRDIPPIRYEEVYKLKREFPHLQSRQQTLQTAVRNSCKLRNFSFRYIKKSIE